MTAGFEPSYPTLTHEQSITASLDERIASVWPWVRKFVAQSCVSRPAREVANFDFDDILQEAWLELRAKNHDFDPTRGNYYSFARRLVMNLIYHIRDRSLTVHLPRDSGYAERCFERRRDQGLPITPERQETYNRIQSARVQYYLTPDAAITPIKPADGDEATIEPEARQTLVDSIGVLEPIQARVIGLLHGLWGQVKLTPQEVADKLGIDVARVMSIKQSAFRKIRRKLLESGHAAVASDN